MELQGAAAGRRLFVPVVLPVVLPIVLIGLAGACGLPSATTDLNGGGSTPPTPPCGDCEGEDGGGSAPPAQNGATVGFLETMAPSVSEFILRGTLPLPPHTYPRIDGRDPLVLLDWNGTPLATQTEIVSRYADEAEGADVVEVLAKVHRDPAVAPGSFTRYKVVQTPSVPLPGPGTIGIDDLLDTESVPISVQGVLGDPNGIEIATYDCFGNKYVCRPLDGTGTLELMRRGRVQTEIRVYQTMKPEPFLNGPAGTLPHFFGVHAYLSTFTGQQIIGLDLRFHNGHCGRDTTTTLDNPLDQVYFEKVEVSVPASWTLMQDFDDPFLGGFTASAGRWVWNLVQPNANGKMHVMRWQGQFHRRLMLVTGTDQGLARSYQNGVGRGFCVRGTDPVLGHQYWSWWNRGTARYWPQRYQLPSLDHVGLGALRGQLAGAHDSLEGYLEQGTSNAGDYPVQAPVLGWGHPYGVSYGGMTGGNEIFCRDGVSTVAAASTLGYRMYAGLHRMHTDRMPTALYELDGEPTSVERWLRENGNQDYVPFYCFLNPMLDSGDPDPFGFASAPRFQIDYVQNNGLVPGYEGLHLSFAPHDFQHFSRYTRSAKVLAWLGNDSLAKDDLRMQAENFHLSFHRYHNDAFGGIQTSGLRAMKNGVAAHPGKGCVFGRGEAWGLDCAVAAYALSDSAWRASKRPWFADVIETLLAAQGSCTGFIQGLISDKALDGKYRARQQIEQSITENTLQGLRETVFRRFDPGHTDMTRDVMVNSLYAFIGEMAWFPGQNGPWRYSGIGPLNINQPIWCSRSQMPGDAWTAGDTETYLNWSSFAYGFELTGDPLFFDFATIEIGGGNLLNRLKNEGTDNIENRSALLALMQHRNGDI